VTAPEFDEAVHYLRRIEGSGCDEEGTWSGGIWIRSRSLPLVHDANRVMVLEQGFGLSLDAVTAAADEIQAGLPNRIVEFVECDATLELAAGFRAAPWLDESLGVMVRHRAPDRTVDTSAVRVIDEPEMRAAMNASLWDEAWATDDSVPQVREKQERVARAVRTTRLGILEDGRVVSYCEVFEMDDVAMIESVSTMPAHRRRGYSRTVMTRALALTQDTRLVFLNMDPTDWPQELYSRLGMDVVGRVLRFRRALPGS
jgi:hypothetical protein